jgi:hypothetical protein
MSFDPDEYLKKEKRDAQPFDPDKYLGVEKAADGVIPELRPQKAPMEQVAEQEAARFDPDRYLGQPRQVGTIEGTIGSVQRGVKSAQQTGNLLGAVIEGKTVEDWLNAADAADAKAEELETSKPLLPFKFAEEKRKQYAQEFRARAEHSRQMAAEAAKDVPQKIARVGQLDKEIASIPQSRGKEEFDRAQGARETLRAVARHPIESISGIAAESLPASAPSLALGAVGSLAGAPGTAAGAGIGSFAAEYGSKMLDELRAEGVDFDKPETVEAVFKNPQKMARIRDKAVARGVPVALFDALSAGVAGKLVTAPGKTAAQRVGHVATELAIQGGLGGAGEAAGSLAAGDKVNFKDVLAEVLGEVGGGAHEIAMGAFREHAHAAGSDTGRNVPESRETLLAQQKAVLEGRQPAQMFPEGTKELPLPKGLDRVETERGVFHFDPQQISGAEIEQLSNAGRENEFLGLGPANKEEIARRAQAGEPVSALVEKTPAGDEVKGAVVVPSTEAATRSEMEARMGADNQLVRQPTNQTILERLRAQEEEQLRAQAEARDRELKAREQRATASLESQSAAPREAADTSIIPADSVLSSQTQPGEALTKPVTERSGEGNVANQPGSSKRVRIGARADGQIDVLDAIDQIGGVRPPDSKSGGEYDGFREAFGRGSAKLLVRREAGPVDVKMQELSELGFHYSTPDDLYRAVQTAVKERGKIKELARSEQQTQSLQAQLLENKGRGSDARAASPVNSDSLTVGDRFKAKGEQFKVTDISPDTGEVTVQDGPRFGTQVLPASTSLYPDPKSLRRVKAAVDPEAAFATGRDQKPLANVDAEREIAAIRRAFPELTKRYDIEVGQVENALRERGFKGEVPAEVQAAIVRVNARRDLIVISAQAYRDRASGASLLTHEVAHSFYDSLPEATKELLREFHREEIGGKTGPLFDEKGEMRSSLKFVDEVSERGVKEWFAERVARLNEEWAQSRVESAANANTLIGRLAYELREFVRKVWQQFAKRDGIDPQSELFESQFRKYWLRGGDEQVARDAGTAFAEAKNIEFARKKEPVREGPLPKVDRRDSLIEEYNRGRKMKERGENTGNLIAEHWGERMMSQNQKMLDEEFPGWNGKPPAPAVPREIAAQRENVQPAQEGDAESSPFAGQGDAPPPNRGRALDIYGHTAWQPSFLEKTWTGTKKILSGFKGALPDLPTFGDAAWNKSDPFIKKNGGQFYNRLREGIRRLRISNDHIQTEAASKVEAIVSPLQKLGEGFSADDYAKLQRRQEQARKFAAEKKQMPEGARVELEALNAKLESSPYVLFEKLVLMLDMQWRYEHLKDSAGNPIALPMGLNSTEVKAELARLGGLVEVSGHRDAIAKAIEGHMELVKNTSDELKSRGLMSEEELSNPYYFPHLTLQKTVGGETTERQLVPSRVSVDTAADFRGYLVDPVGSRKPIETDYVKAMYYHMVQVGAHNLRDDVAHHDFKHYDVMKEVEARAAKLSKERGVPVSWEQAFHEEYADDGYVIYGAGTGDLYSGAKIDRNKLAQQLAIPLSSESVRDQLKQLGLQGVKILPEDIRAALEAGERETWILPARVAETLRRVIADGDRKDGAIESALKKINGLWKGWKLFMPWNHIRYEYGNIAADMEKLFSADPTAFKYVPQSAKEISAFFAGKSKGSPDLKAAIREGVINSITAQEMSQLPSLKAFEEFRTTGEKITRESVSRLTTLLLQPVTVPLGLGNLSSVQISAMREAVTRYAKFKADLDRLRNGARPAYAGAYWKDVEAIQDSRPGAKDANERKAADISLKTFGDYGDVSVNGRWLREKMIPFYSWIEVNFKYHANLFRNLRDMATVGEMTKAQAARAGGIAIVGTGARAAAGVLLRLAVPYVAVAMWNAGTGLEDDLSDEDRRRFHIILGKGADGKVDVVYAPTAFLDVIKWFSGPEFMRQAGDWMRGRTDMGTAVSAWAQHVPGDLVNNTLGQLGPVGKIPYTLASKKNPFPDVTDQRTIPSYDMKRVILGQMTDDFTADQVMRVIDKDYLAPKDAGDWAKQLILQIRQRDPEQWAFYAIKDKAAEFVTDQTGKKRETDYDAPDQQVLRNFRKSIYRGDTENAMRFYERLLELGYTAERFQASIRAQDPLAGVPKELRKEFVTSLSEFDRDQLRRAYEFYTRMTEQQGSERVLFPRERVPAAYRLNFKPQTERLMQEMGQRSSADGEEIARKAQQEMQRSMRPARPTMR